VITVNPVLAREMRSRMRGHRAAVLLTAWLVVNGGVLALVYLAAENLAQDRFGVAGFANTVAIGRGVYGWTLFGMLLLMLLIVPAQAAGAIAGERERQTLIPLQVTLLSPWKILVGKLAASVAFLVLLVVAGLPLLAVGYLVGGVTVADVLLGAAVVLLAGLLVAGMCVAISTFSRRVQASTVLCYALVLALTAGTFLAYGAYAVIDRSRGIDAADPPREILLLNPVAFVAGAVGDTEESELTSPFDALHRMLEERDGVDDGFVVQPIPVPGGFGGQPIVGRPGGEERSGPPFWLVSGFVLSVVSVGGLVLATRRLQTPAEAER
jgi:ABC-2 type transport system permease protein